MTQATRRRRVLIVEDEPALRLSYDRAFRPRYDLAFASNGAEAMEKLEQHQPEVAVLDIVSTPPRKPAPSATAIATSAPCLRAARAGALGACRA